MTQSAIRHHDISPSSVTSDAGRTLVITGQLYEPAATCDYWLGTYLATPTEGEKRKFTLVVPKRIAESPPAALKIMEGQALASVREICALEESADAAVLPRFSPEGWSIT